MNKTAIKNYAVWARRELIKRVSDRANLAGIFSEKDIRELPMANNQRFAIGNEFFDISARTALIEKVKTKGYNNIIEEVAYTWFNRFVALRFMEVNGYLGNGATGENIFCLGSNSVGNNLPDIVKFATKLCIGNKTKIYDYLDKNNEEGLYRYLLLSECAELHNILPQVFERVDDYTEILLPDNLLSSDNVLQRLVKDISKDDFDINKSGQIEIIGWLYQYYISEKKDKVFEDLAKNVKISKENIPAATQLFTPDWIVKYLIENSLGRLWLENKLQSRLKEEMKYYLADNGDNDKNLNTNRLSLTANFDLREIKILDPSCGSGHILVYAFDLLYKMYIELGYVVSEIPKLILQNNIFGLDIDSRAIQLTAFALIMKARSYNKNFFAKCGEFDINVSTIKSSEFFPMDAFVSKKDNQIYEEILELISVFRDGEEYGSIIKLPEIKIDLIENYVRAVEISDKRDMFESRLAEYIKPLIKQYRILTNKYDVVCTNPPYMGASGMNAKLSDYCKDNYPDSKSDLFSVFIEKCGEFAKNNGYISMITMHSWMFLSSFERLRKKLIVTKEFCSMAHLGARAFEEISGEVVQTTAFVLKNKSEDK